MMSKTSEKCVVMLVHDDRIDRRVLNQARTLVRQGWKVTVVGFPPPFVGYCEDEEVYPEVKIVRVDLEHEPVVPPSDVQLANVVTESLCKIFPWHTHFLAEALKRPAYIYVAHDLPQLAPAFVAAHQHGAYLVYDAHELYPDQSLFEEQGLTTAMTRIEQLIAPYIDRMITVNQSLATLLALRCKVEQPAIILNTPALPKHLTLPVPRTNLLRLELKIPADKFILLYQGMFALTRNLQNVIRAMALVKNPDVVFVLMGPHSRDKNELEKLTKSLGLLNKRIFFHNAISQEELLVYTASADAGIIPYPPGELNNYYCTPNKLFEFIVAGLPILANNLPELNRFVSGQGVGINVSMKNPLEIAAAIDRFVEKGVDQYRAQINELSPTYVWAVEEKKLLKIYNDLIKAPPRSTQMTPEMDWEEITRRLPKTNTDTPNTDTPKGFLEILLCWVRGQVHSVIKILQGKRF